jgi:tetratricopeptide (TPR) repeat protein
MTTGDCGAPALMHEGIERLRQRDFPAALACFNRVVAEQPGSIEALICRGRALGNLGRHLEASRSFSSALLIAPEHADAQNNLGVALHKLGRNNEALACFEKVLVLAPRHPDALTNRGFVLQDLGRLEEALLALELALSVSPRSTAALHARAMTLERLGLRQQALEQLDRVLAVDSLHVDAWGGRAVALGRLGRLEEARAAFARALEIAPGNLDVLFNLSFLQLTEGELLQGFRGQTLRWTAMQPRLDPGTDRPIWLGQPALTGRTLLLHHEQGFGDTLQLARYAPLVAARAGHVLLRAPGPLVRVLGTLAGGVQIVPEGAALPAHDLHCPLTCLPAALGTTLTSIPAQHVYLAASAPDTDEWGRRLGPVGAPRIGLVWRGHPQHRLCAERDMPLTQLLRLADLPAVLISLQKEVPAAEQAELEASGRIARHGESLGDFADTAALIANLDLVISVDTAVAHLAGALGKPVWILNRHVPCWRWLRDRTDSPWYPSARLFRQSAPGDWAGVIAQVREAAQTWCREQRVG